MNVHQKTVFLMYVLVTYTKKVDFVKMTTVSGTQNCIYPFVFNFA
jgi:hypothetical protein